MGLSLRWLSPRGLVILAVTAPLFLGSSTRALVLYEDADEFEKAATATSADPPPPIPVDAFVNGTTNSTNATYPTPPAPNTEGPSGWDSFLNDTALIGNTTTNNTVNGTIDDNAGDGWTGIDIDVPMNNGTDGWWNGTWNGTWNGNDTVYSNNTQSPIPSPAPDSGLSPITAPAPAPDNSTPVPSPENPPEPCTGVVFDGYLHGCVIYLDLNGNKQRDDGEPFGISNMGMFSVDVPYGSLPGAVFRMEPANTRGPVSPGAGTCHDISTLMPERLPLAARAPQSCGPDADPVVLSPLSTLAAIIGESQVEDVLELPAGILGSDILRSALDGNQDALRIMRREVQVKNMVSMVSSAATSNQNAYSRIAWAAFNILGDLFSGPQDTTGDSIDGSTSNPGITSRRMLLQSSTSPSPEALTLASIFHGLYATLAADPEIDLSDIAFVSNDTMLAVATSVATFNDLSDSLAGTVQDIYRLVLLMETRLLPAIQSLVAGNTTAEEFLQSNTLEKMTRSFEQTSLPEGSIPDPLSVAPSPAPAPAPGSSSTPTVQGSSSALRMGLGIGLGLGLPIAAVAIAAFIRWRRRSATRHAESAFVPTSRLSGNRSSRIQSKICASSPAVAEIVAASSRSPISNVV